MNQFEEEPPINKMVEDALAIAGGDDDHEATILRTIILHCAERLARTLGRRACRVSLQNVDHFIRTAEPAKPWKD